MGKIRVNVSREDAMWVAVIPSLKRLRVEARHLPALDPAVRRAVAEITNVHADDMDDIELDYRYGLGDAALDRELADIRATREMINRLLSTVVDRTGAAAAQLIEDHRLSVRDVAVLTGASPGRISQLVPQGVGNFGLGVEVPPRGQGVTKAAREAARAKRAEAVQPAIQPASVVESEAPRKSRYRRGGPLVAPKGARRRAESE